jgi:hypothetical protein
MCNLCLIDNSRFNSAAVNLESGFGVHLLGQTRAPHKACGLAIGVRYPDLKAAVLKT